MTFIQKSLGQKYVIIFPIPIFQSRFPQLERAERNPF